VDLLRDQYEAAVLESWLDPDTAPEPSPSFDDDAEQTWFSISRIGYDADTFAVIQREPEVHWFG